MGMEWRNSFIPFFFFFVDFSYKYRYLSIYIFLRISYFKISYLCSANSRRDCYGVCTRNVRTNL